MKYNISHENKPMVVTEEMTVGEYGNLIGEELRKVPFNPSELWSAGKEADATFPSFPLFMF